MTDKLNPILSVETPSADDARKLYADVLSDLPDGSAFDTSGLLKAHPGLRSHKSVVVDLAFEEYTRRLELGEDLTPTEFASRFPTIQKSLVQLLEVNRFLFDNSLVPPSLAETVWPGEGATFLNFELVTEIGRGSFSRVFLARETDLGDRQVVVKVCVGGAHEAQILGKLQHDGIVPVYSADLDVTTGLSAICMPYVGRTTLIDVLDMTLEVELPTRASQIADVISGAGEKSTNPDLSSRFRGTYVDGVVTIARDLAVALEYSHGEGIVHSDIKPSNVLLTPAGRAMLIDFNLSHDEESTTRFGGTFPYMAPEQLRGLTGDEEPCSLERDIRTDIYALGATLFELLTGELPFDMRPDAGVRAEERPKTARRLLERQQQGPASIRELIPQIDRELADIIQRCLRFAPEDRWQTPNELEQALARHQTRSQQTRRFYRAHQKAVLSAAAMMLLLLGAVGGALLTREPLNEREMRLGREAMAERNYPMAVSHFTTILDSEPADQALMARGEGLLAMADGADTQKFADAYYQNARIDFEIVEKERGDAMAFAALGYCDVAGRKHYQGGMRRFREASMRGWDDPLALANNLGYCELKQAHFDEAESQFGLALRLAPNRQIVLHNLGRLNYLLASRRKRYDASYILRAAELGEDSAEIWLEVAAMLALCSRRVLPTAHPPTDGQLEESQRFAEQAIEAAEKAVELGAIPARLQKLTHWLPFESQKLNLLIQRPSPEKPPVRLRRMINPFDDQNTPDGDRRNRDA